MSFYGILGQPTMLGQATGDTRDTDIIDDGDAIEIWKFRRHEKIT